MTGLGLLLSCLHTTKEESDRRVRRQGRVKEVGILSQQTNGKGTRTRRYVCMQISGRGAGTREEKSETERRPKAKMEQKREKQRQIETEE